MSTEPRLEWVVLTRGDRCEALESAVRSLGDQPVSVVWNGARPRSLGVATRVVEAAANLGVPGGRDLGLRSCDADLVGFLDDDAVARAEVAEVVTAAFAADDRLGAVALRLVDEAGETARRHVPRLGGRGADRSGEVALFLGGACVLRREAYERVGGYFTELFYGHEEVELCWRLVDDGWRIRYLADVEVFHPRTPIERHAAGWELTGRNRVLIARRTLPWPVAIVHVALWLAIGWWRAPGAHRRDYARGWQRGWRVDVDRHPISWRGVWRLTRLGRPPIL